MHAGTWADMFNLGLPLLEKILRPVFVYAFLVVGLRIAGKRELAQLNPFDLVVLLTLSNTVQNAIIGEDNSVTGGVVGAATLLAVNYLVVRFLYRHKTIDRLVEGRAEVLLEHGKIRKSALGKELITRAELETAARRQGFATLDDVAQAVLETGGTITFVGKKPAPEESRHLELLARFDQLLGELRALRPSGNPRQA